MTSAWIVLAASGIVIQLVPPSTGERVETRVERWAALNAAPPEAGSGIAVDSWIGRIGEERPPIPLAAILETEAADLRFETIEPVKARSRMAGIPRSRGEGGATYRTVCVRLCDGAYFPVSFSTTEEHFAADESVCAASCEAPSRLFVYRNPGQRPDDMVDRTGHSYAELATAFQFRVRYEPSCTCGSNPWEQEAQDRHRLYALEKAARSKSGKRSPGVGQQVGQQMALIRERQARARQERQRSMELSRDLAGASPEVLSGGASFASVVAPITSARKASETGAPAEGSAEPTPAMDRSPGGDREMAAIVVPAAGPPAAVPLVELGPSGNPIDGASAPAAGDGKAQLKDGVKPAKSRREARLARAGPPRQRPRLAASRPARIFIVRRWASRSPADEMRRNLMRGSF